jgi:hypothetical protein
MSRGPCSDFEMFVRSATQAGGFDVLEVRAFVHERTSEMPHSAPLTGNASDRYLAPWSLRLD